MRRRIISPLSSWALTHALCTAVRISAVHEATWSMADFAKVILRWACSYSFSEEMRKVEHGIPVKC